MRDRRVGRGHGRQGPLVSVQEIVRWVRSQSLRRELGCCRQVSVQMEQMGHCRLEGSGVVFDEHLGKRGFGGMRQCPPAQAGAAREQAAAKSTATAQLGADLPSRRRAQCSHNNLTARVSGTGWTQQRGTAPDRRHVPSAHQVGLWPTGDSTEPRASQWVREA